jgi:hypothetical protein
MVNTTMDTIIAVTFKCATSSIEKKETELYICQIKKFGHYPHNGDLHG